MDEHDDGALLAEQAAYYRAGAAEYDGQYAGHDGLTRLLATVDAMPVHGDVLELACGTGQWTALLAARARSLTAVDASAEMLAEARHRVETAGGSRPGGTPSVRFERADLFTWWPERRYDTVFFGFWLSHVPPSRVGVFWDAVGAALAPGGQVVFVDDGPGDAAHEDVLPGLAAPAARRRLADGSEHRIVKVLYDPPTLERDLAARGWSARVSLDGEFLVGTASPPRR